MKRSTLLATTAAMLFSVPAFAADVVIGVPNWPSVAATANVLKVVIEDNLGLEVELQNGTNPIVFEAMDKGSMHRASGSLDAQSAEPSRYLCEG